MSDYKNNVGHKKFFEGISEDYKIGNEINIDLLVSLSNAASDFIKGKVLDIGNGGLIIFDINKAQSVTLADISLEAIQNPELVKDGFFVSLDEANRKKNRICEGRCFEFAVCGQKF